MSVYSILLSIDTKPCAKYYARSITVFMGHAIYLIVPNI